MADLVKITLRQYVKEARILYLRLHVETKYVGTIEDAQCFIEMKQRYRFLTDMFMDFNWFDWNTDEFNVGEKL